MKTTATYQRTAARGGRDMGARACICPEEGPLWNIMHRTKQVFEPKCTMRNILFNGPLAESQVLYLALIIRMETRQLCLNLTQEKKLFQSLSPDRTYKYLFSLYHPS